MAEPPLDSIAGVSTISEISREEIIKQIFGDIGELIDGMSFLLIIPPQPYIDFIHILLVAYLSGCRLYLCGGVHGAPTRAALPHVKVYLFLF